MAYNVQLKKSNGSLYEDVYVATKWSLISDKPSTFTPTSHQHTKSEITDFPNISGGTGIELKAIGSAPTSATSGDYYYNTTDKKIYKYDTSWSEWLGE